MNETFRAVLIDKAQEGQSVCFTELANEDLMDGDVDVRILNSTLNYKDGLAITGKSPVVRRWPMVPGIDFVGEVTRSTNERFSAGNMVVLNGWGVGETHLGGFSQRARVKGDWLITLPVGLTPAQSMAIGTAGYTAMLGVLAIEGHDIKPDSGDVLVTGAAGGVGSVAVALLSGLGYRVIASTGRLGETDYIKSLGAADVINRSELSEQGRPLGKEKWIAAIDAVGSHTLANVIAQTKYGGIVAACGLAQGSDLPSTVMPFILRGVTLRGIDSVMAPRDIREQAWTRLASDIDLAKLDAVTTKARFDDILDVAPWITEGHVRGRIVIEVP